MALSLLRSEHATFHGFALAQTMREQTGSRSLTGHGTLYKALGRLEEFGLLSSRWEDAAAAEGRPRRRLYELTSQGAHVAERALRGQGRRPFPATRPEARMTPERVVRLVDRWVRFYTRKLPAPVAQRRVDEIGADLHDHIAHERARGTSDRRIALSICLAHGPRPRRRRLMARPPSPSTAKEAMNTNRSTIGIVLAPASILLLPLLAMQFTDEMAWGVFDFVLAGVLLVGIGLVYALVRNAGNLAYRAAVGIAIAAALLLVWMVGALGVIGETGDRADLMYGAVLAVGIVGAIVARFRPEGMARALLATALVQALVAVIALIAGKHEAAISSVAEILLLNGIFVALFIGSAWLFRHAARTQPRH